jgi:hypothetical protein
LKDRRRRGGLLSPRDLAPYASASRNIARPYERLARLALFFSRHPAWTELAVRILARQPGLFRFLLYTTG